MVHAFFKGIHVGAVVLHMLELGGTVSGQGLDKIALQETAAEGQAQDQ